MSVLRQSVQTSTLSYAYRAAWTGSYITVLMLSLLISQLHAGDWPQILGPDRNGVAQGERLTDWGGQPKKAWSFPVGNGFAGPVVVDTVVYAFHRVANSERIEAIDALSGKSRWKVDFPGRYRGGINPDNGPRCVPVVTGDRVIAFGASGDLYCVDRNSGKEIWKRSLATDYDAPEGYFGAGSTPIVVGDKVLVNVGGKGKSSIVAVALTDGQSLWTTANDEASYSSPSQFAIDGKAHVLFLTRLNLFCVEPTKGDIVFQVPFGRKGPTVNAAVPLTFNKNVFLTASYGIGAKLMSVEGNKPKLVWGNDDTLSSQYSSAVYHKGYLYGVDGREDGPPGELRCVEAETGKVIWKQPNLGIAHLILVGDELLVLTVDGRLIRALASPEKYVEKDSAQVSTSVTRALPALSRGRLYFRDNQDRGGNLMCFEVGK